MPGDAQPTDIGNVFHEDMNNLGAYQSRYVHDTIVPWDTGDSLPTPNGSPLRDAATRAAADFAAVGLVPGDVGDNFIPLGVPAYRTRQIAELGSSLGRPLLTGIHAGPPESHEIVERVRYREAHTLAEAARQAAATLSVPSVERGSDSDSDGFGAVMRVSLREGRRPRNDSEIAVTNGGAGAPHGPGGLLDQIGFCG